MREDVANFRLSDERKLSGVIADASHVNGGIHNKIRDIFDGGFGRPYPQEAWIPFETCSLYAVVGYFYGANGTVEYGIMLHDGRGDGYEPNQIAGDVKELQDHHAAPTKPSRHLPFLMLVYAGRLVLLFVLCGLLGLILYYNNTGGNTPFKGFMNSESFDMRFLFTGINVVTSFFWASFFSSKYSLSPNYRSVFSLTGKGVT
ncbi:hypothetical protein K449DRAFT_464467 [Hypoxylon sp. EC38]|nr:hypothetical protein K449DRAFT_464467 [Hypoxylon sp. EC38]